MKKAISVLGMPFVCCFVLAQCDSVLDTGPIGELSTETFYKTPQDFDAAVLGAYSAMLNMYWDGSGGPNSAYLPFLYPDDDVRPPHNTAHPLTEFNWLSDNGYFAVLWNESYKGIMRANVILQQLPLAPGFPDESEKARFEAEARFMRAYFHFLLARNFGQVPLVDRVFSSLADARVENSQEGEVWNLIETDLAFATESLPPSWDGTQVGRATRYSAFALLGKARLYRAQWLGEPAKYGEAAAALEQAGGGGAMLLPNYGDNFLVETENNTESLFEIQFSLGNGGQNPWLPTDFGLAGNQDVGAAGTGRQSVWGPGCGPVAGDCAPTAGGSSQGLIHILPGLQNAFEPGDPRRFFTMYSEGEPFVGETVYRAAWSVTGTTPAKYVRPFREVHNVILDTNNERVIRYADALLMLAEARLLGAGDVAGAAELVNRVRARARQTYEILHGSPVPAGALADVPPTGTPEQWFRQYLEPERRVELALESHRYDDLVRWHRAGLIDIPRDIDFGDPTAQSAWSERHLLKPIPQSELDNNPNLSQNPGY